MKLLLMDAKKMVDGWPMQKIEVVCYSVLRYRRCVGTWNLKFICTVYVSSLNNFLVPKASFIEPDL